MQWSALEFNSSRYRIAYAIRGKGVSELEISPSITYLDDLPWRHWRTAGKSGWGSS